MPADILFRLQFPECQEKPLYQKSLDSEFLFALEHQSALVDWSNLNYREIGVLVTHFDKVTEMPNVDKFAQGWLQCSRPTVWTFKRHDYQAFLFFTESKTLRIWFAKVRKN